jgi:hypothetical protein
MYDEDDEIREGLDKEEGETLLSKLHSLLDNEKHYMFILQNCRD